jgi:LemA protein
MQKYLGWIVLGAIILLGFVGCGAFSGNVTARNNVDAKMGNIQQTLQQRNDMIPNLEATVEGAAAQNRIFVEIAQARAGLTPFLQMSPAELASNPELFAQFAAAQAAMARATSAQNFRIVTEAYPELASNENFLMFQEQIEGMENRIGTARRDYNQAVLTYNNRIQIPPGMLFAGLCNCTPRQFYQASSENVEQAPRVSFDRPAAPQQPAQPSTP